MLPNQERPDINRDKNKQRTDTKYPKEKNMPENPSPKKIAQQRSFDHG